MPEVEGIATVTLNLTDEDAALLIKTRLNDKPVQLSTGDWAKRTKEGNIEIESEQEVTLDFELSDYAQERDEP